MDAVKPRKQVVVVCGLITDDNGQVLLALRHEPALPSAHLKWELPGGGVEFGEKIEEALRREMIEEIGAEVEVGEIIPYIHVGEWEFPAEIIQAFVINYFCRIKKGSVINHTANHEQEIAELKWFQVKNIPWDQCLPGLREIFQAAKLI